MLSKKPLASIKIDKIKHVLSEGETIIGDLKFTLALENKAENLFSWVVYLENLSSARSPRISEFLGLDLAVDIKGETIFNTLRGDDCSIYSFLPESMKVMENEVITRAPIGARSSNTTAFPYFDIVDENGNGIVCGIGWSGQWKLDIERKGDIAQIKAGFQDCDFVLEGKEKIRSIRALVYFGSGGEDALRHEFVRLHRKHYSPIPTFDDSTYFPIAGQCFDRYYWGNLPPEKGNIFFETEEAQKIIIEKSSQCQNFNTYWIDAFWFDGAFRTGVGNYRYANGFPNGLKGLSDLAHSKGLKFVLWFEPVRVFNNTDIDKLFGHDKNKVVSLDEEGRRKLANLGDDEVWQYQFDNISRIIEENKVDIYRQDFNIEPYDYLKTIESPDRVGINQIRFVEGVYKLWDALKERFPNLIIDNCASGGRLIDVETNMRAIPLWQSDMACRPSPIAMQNENLTLSRYIPYHQGASFDYSPYFLRSTFTTGIACEFSFLTGAIDPINEQTSMNTVSNGNFLITEVKNKDKFVPSEIDNGFQDVLRLKKYWSGDFTALTPPSINRTDIVAYTLRLKEQDEGAIVVFRREDALDNFLVKLPEINLNKEYELLLSDENLAVSKQIVLGKDLFNGFNVTLLQPPSSLLITYKPKK